MTKSQLADSILFALDELRKAQAELEKISAIDIEKRAPSQDASALMGEVAAYNFGRAESMANTALMWIRFATRTLNQCVDEEA